jgi:3-oxoacyl-[acyl-carrier protein] reductase
VKRFGGRLAVVTGATRGIGRAVAERLMAEGAEVVGTCTSAEGEMPEGCRREIVRFDDAASTAEFCKRLAAMAPQILVNNAGVALPQTAEELTEADLRRVHEINLVAPIRTCQAVVPGMKKAGWGRIVNVTSIWGPMSRVARGNYASSKSGLDGFTGVLAAELAPFGVLANSVAPGYTETELIKKIFDGPKLKALADTVPMRRLAEPAEIAAFIAWMASPENGYVTGQNIVIDGGLSRLREV